MKKTLSILLILCLAMMILVVPAMAEEPVKLTIFINHTWYGTDTFTGFIPEEITRQTGIVLEPTIAVDNTQLGVMVASGDMPDLIYTSEQIDTLADPDVSYAYNELIEQYNVDWEPTAAQIGVGKLFNNVPGDDNYYCILNHVDSNEAWAETTGLVPMAPSIQIRQKIYEEIGSPELNSLDDMLAAFAKVKELYPDMVCMRISWSWEYRPLRVEVGLPDFEFVEGPDGTYIHYTEDPKFVEIMKFLNECYLKGYISTDDGFFIENDNTSIAKDNFFCLLHCTQDGLTSANADLKGLGCDDNYFVMMPFDSANYATSDIGWSATFITKSCSNPEAAINLMKWMFSFEGQKVCQMGREGIDYTVDENGFYVFSDDWKAATNDGTLIEKYNPWYYLGGSAIVEAASRIHPEDAPLCADAYAKMLETYKNEPWLKAALPQGSGDDAILYAKYKELRLKYEKKMILSGGADEVDAIYAEFMKDAEAVGLATLDANYNAKLAEVMPSFQ